MGRCVSFFMRTLILLGPPLALMMISEVARDLFRVNQRNLEHGALSRAVTTVGLLRHFTYCLGDYLGCVKDEVVKDIVHTYSWKHPQGIAVIDMPLLGVVPIHFTHKSYKEVVSDPKAGRPRGYMVFSKKENLPDGYLPDGVADILLNLNTGDSGHTARRKLLADGLPALAQKPSTETLPLLVPKGVAGSDAAVFGLDIAGFRYMHLRKKVFSMVGLNLFSELFGADINDLLDEHFEYDSLFTPGVLGVPVSTSSGARLREIRSKVFKKVQQSQGGQKFMELAESRGMNGTTRLQEAVWITMFAGYGGTSNLAFETIKLILKEPAKYTALFNKDPEAFMLEAVRMVPPVGGMNPYQVTKPQNVSVPSGNVHMLKPGDIGIVLTSGANRDPQVFEEPADFSPGRDNADRVLSWNAEVRDFRTCETVAGCPAAPRGCPGMFLSLRLSTRVVAFFVEGIQSSLHGREGEL